MEEVIAKSVRTMYIVMYSICIVLGLVVIGMGILFTVFINDEVALILGVFFIVLGLILLAASIVWLVYFVKMPEDAIKLKDGKLYFRNGIVCSPTEVDNCVAKSMGIDGALFSFGKLFVTVQGKEFKLKFIDKASAVPSRLFMLKAEYTVKENILKNQQNAGTAQSVQTEEKIQEENNG